MSKPKYRVTRAFKFAPDGINTREIAAGTELEPGSRAEQIARENGWAEPIASNDAALPLTLARFAELLGWPVPPDGYGRLEALILGAHAENKQVSPDEIAAALAPRVAAVAANDAADPDAAAEAAGPLAGGEPAPASASAAGSTSAPPGAAPSPEAGAPDAVSSSSQAAPASAQPSLSLSEKPKPPATKESGTKAKRK